MSNKGRIPWNLGIPCSDKTKEKIRLSNLGQKPWNRGLKNVNGKCGAPKGRIPWNKNIPHSKETKIKIGLANTGKKRTEEQILKMTERNSGENCYMWLGGKSFEPYGFEFNERLKRKIRKKYNNKCVECDYSKEQLGYNLHIHHIDYDKNNNNEDNLVPLCRSCHARTNFTREDWINHFEELRQQVSS